MPACVNPAIIYGCLNGDTIVGVQLLNRVDGALTGEIWTDSSGTVLTDPRTDPNFVLGSCSGSGGSIDVQAIVDAITNQGQNVDDTALLTSILAAIVAQTDDDDTDDDLRAVAPQHYHWVDGANRGSFYGYLLIAEDGTSTEVVVSGTAPPAFANIVERGLVETEFVKLNGDVVGTAVPYDNAFTGGAEGADFTLTGEYLSMYVVWSKGSGAVDAAGDPLPSSLTIGDVVFELDCGDDACLKQDPLFEHVYKEDHVHEGPIVFTAQANTCAHIQIVREVN